MAVFIINVAGRPVAYGIRSLHLVFKFGSPSYSEVERTSNPRINILMGTEGSFLHRFDQYIILHMWPWKNPNMHGSVHLKAAIVFAF